MEWIGWLITAVALLSAAGLCCCGCCGVFTTCASYIRSSFCSPIIAEEINSVTGTWIIRRGAEDKDIYEYEYCPRYGYRTDTVTTNTDGVYDLTQNTTKFYYDFDPDSQLVTSDDGAKIIFNEEMSDGDRPTFNARILFSNYLDTSERIATIYLLYTDANNYLKLVVKKTYTGTLTGGGNPIFSGSVKAYSVVGGTSTEIPIHVPVAVSNPIIDHDFNICITNNEVVVTTGYFSTTGDYSKFEGHGFGSVGATTSPPIEFTFFNPQHRQNGRFGIENTQNGTDSNSEFIITFNGCATSYQRWFKPSFINTIKAYGVGPVTYTSLNDSCHPCGLKITATGDNEYYDTECDCTCCNSCDNVCDEGELPDELSVTFGDNFIASYSDFGTACCVWDGSLPGNELNGETYILKLVDSQRDVVFADRDWVKAISTAIGTRERVHNCVYIHRLPDIEDLQLTDRTSPQVVKNFPPDLDCAPCAGFSLCVGTGIVYGELYPQTSCSAVHSSWTIERYIIADIMYDAPTARCGNGKDTNPFTDTTDRQASPNTKTLRVRLVNKRISDNSASNIQLPPIFIGEWTKTNMDGGCSGSYTLTWDSVVSGGSTTSTTEDISVTL